MGYVAGMTSLKKHLILLLVAIFINTWGLMLLYVMAYPTDFSERVVKHDEYDVDLAVRLWQLASVQYERQRCFNTLRRWWYRLVFSVFRGSSLARSYIRVA